MLEIIASGTTLPQAYHAALCKLYRFGEVVPCPDYDTTQKEVTLTMVVDSPLHEPMISRCFYGDPRSLEQYRQEMLDGILDFEVGRGNWVYTYHQRYAEQYQFIIDELKRNPYSRRAVMDIRTKDDMYSVDPACWQHVQYFIRGNKLHCKVLFRSNDACKATFMNAFALIMLQKRIADELGIEIGAYTHRANSFHCYERDFGLLEGYVNRINSGKETTYNYKGEWDELMIAERPSIQEMVNSLKNQPITDTIENTDICSCCANHIECDSTKCKCFIGERHINPTTGQEMFWEWTCEDYEYGDCPFMLYTPCHNCKQNGYNNFKINKKKIKKTLDNI